MKLMLRNTSRDRATEALRKSRPGNVQSNPVLSGIRLPPGGSLNVEVDDLSREDVELIAGLMDCGCIATFHFPSRGPLVPLASDQFLGLFSFAEVPAAPAPDPAPKSLEVEVEVPTFDDVEVQEEPDSTEDDSSLDEDTVPGRPPFLRDELTAMKNSELREILAEKGIDKTSGMNKAALVDAVLDTQE